MEVITNTERIAGTISFTETEILQEIVKVLPAEGGIIVLSRITPHRAKAVDLLTKLNAAGLLETRSLGMKGTYIKVLHQEAFKDLVRRVS